MATARKYPEELLERATRLVFESGRPIAHVGRDLGIAPETLRKYVRRVEADEGRRKDVLTSQERDEIKALRKEVAQLRRANEILKSASVFFHEIAARAGRSRSTSPGSTTSACTKPSPTGHPEKSRTSTLPRRQPRSPSNEDREPTNPVSVEPRTAHGGS
jgi:transposase